MKTRTKQDKLEKHKRTFFLIGLIVALSVVLTAFEWTTYEYSFNDFTRTDYGIIDEDIVRITKHETPKPPLPVHKPVSVIKEVDNSKDVDDIELFNPEDTPADSVPEFIFVPYEEADGVIEDIPFRVVEQMPEFPGGNDALMIYLASKVKYTQMAREASIQGTIYVEFIVEKDGSVSNVTLLRGLGGGLDEIALDAVSNMPGWIPGKQRGVPVRVKMTAPFKFKLQ